MDEFKVGIEDNLRVTMEGRRGRLLTAVRRLVQQYGLETAGHVRQELKAGKHVATGDLAKSIDSRTRNAAGGVIEARITSDLPYAVFVHEGTKPHWVPIDSLYEWVRVKRLANRIGAKGGRKAQKYGQMSADFSIARAVQRKIARVGTAAHPFFNSTFNRVGRDITNRLSADIGKAVGEL